MSNFPLKDEITNIRDQVSRVLEDTFSSGGNLPVDVYETADSLIIETAPLLGLDLATLDIGISQGTQITISGETLPPLEILADSYLRRERKFGKFSRTFSLPIAVEAEKAKARFKHNVLTITIPKLTQDKPKVIKITPVD